jgi:uncharacterized repeat protein (TIGR02543 family)
VLKRLVSTVIFSIFLSIFVSPLSANAVVNSVVNCGTSGTFRVELSVVTGNSLCVGTVVVPDGVIQIGFGAFAYANITTVSLPTSLRLIDIIAFRGYPGLSFTIPEGVTTIGAVAFEGSALHTINFPSTLRVIGDHAFSHSALTSLVLPNSLVSVGVEAFYDVTHYPTLYIPDSVTTIGAYAFAFGQYTKLRIGNGLSSIGISAFTGISTLTDVYYCASPALSVVTVYAYNNGKHPVCRAYVQFNVNGGIGSMPGQVSTTAAPLQDNTFIRTGYVFDGWSSTVNGAQIFSDKQSFDFVNQSDQILYARWNRTVTSEELAAAAALVAAERAAAIAAANAALVAAERAAAAVAAERAAAIVAEAARLRRIELEKDKAVVTELFKTGQPVTVEQLRKADYVTAKEEFVNRLNIDLLKLSISSRLDVKQVNALITSIAREYYVVGLLANPKTEQSVIPSQLVGIGLISSDNKNKTAITNELKKLTSVQVDTFEKIKQAVSLQEAVIQARVDRLLAVKASIKNRLAHSFTR